MTNGSKSFLDPARRPTHMVCPKCQLRQPLALDCVGCGAIIERLEDVAVPPTPVPVAPVLAAPAPAAAAPAARPPAPSAKPPAGTDSFLDDPNLDFIPLAEPPPRVPDPASEESEGEDPAGAESDVYQGKNPFSKDGSHSSFGTRGPDTSYRDGHFRPDELSAFSILGEAFSLFSRNLISFTIIAGVAMLPAILFSLHTASELAAYSFEGVEEPAMADVKSVLILMGLSALFSFLCMPIATAAVTYGVGRELRNEKTTMIDCVQAGVRVLLPVLGVTIVQTVLVGLFGLVLFGIGIALLLPMLVALPCLGIVGLFIPLVLVATFAAAFAVTVPATIEERPGIIGALKTSWMLTDGARLTIAFFYFALGAVGVIITLVLGFLGGLLTEEGAELGMQVAQIVVTAINAAGAAVFYFRLRSAAERVPVEKLSSVA